MKLTSKTIPSLPFSQSILELSQEKTLFNWVVSQNSKSIPLIKSAKTGPLSKRWPKNRKHKHWNRIVLCNSVKFKVDLNHQNHLSSFSLRAWMMIATSRSTDLNPLTNIAKLLSSKVCLATAHQFLKVNSSKLMNSPLMLKSSPRLDLLQPPSIGK